MQVPSRAEWLLVLSMEGNYVYTLPEQFLEDSSVPFRWKLYALLNGFWISGKEVFASNEWIAKKLKCSERQVQRTIKELEDLGLLSRQGVSQNRRIMPGTTPAVVGGRRQKAQGDDASRPHISDSIADNIIISSFEKQSEEEIVIEDENARPKRERIEKTAPSSVVSTWNAYPNWKALKRSGTPPNPSVAKELLPTSPNTRDIQGAIVKKRTKYTSQDFEDAIKNYALEIINRKKDSNGFYTHRYTLYEFLTHKNVFEKYLNR